MEKDERERERTDAFLAVVFITVVVEFFIVTVGGVFVVVKFSPFSVASINLTRFALYSTFKKNQFTSLSLSLSPPYLFLLLFYSVRLFISLFSPTHQGSMIDSFLREIRMPRTKQDNYINLKSSARSHHK